MKDRITGFRPESKEDFSKRAKNLAYLIHEPLQRTQELLARIYGYKDLHELQGDMARHPGMPGPYDEDAFNNLLQEDAPRIDLSARANRALEETARIKGTTIKDMDRRLWAVMDIGLFMTPAGHRSDFCAVKNREMVIDGTEPGGEKLDVNDYATIDIGSEGEAIAQFTPLGKSIYDAVAHLTADAENQPRERLQSLRAQILAIAEKHPNNPWPLAIYLCSFSARMYQQPWEVYWDSQYNPRFVDPAIRIAGQNNARKVLPLAKRAIQLFRKLYGKKGKKLADTRLASFHYPFGSDTFYYPTMLYFGGIIAMNAGEYELAHRWMAKEKNHPSHLAMAKLLLGRKGIARLHRLKGNDRTTDPCAYIAAAAESHSKGDTTQATDFFIEAMVNAFAVMEAFATRDPRTANLHIGISHHTPLHIQEFMHHTQLFWSSHKATREHFSRIAADKKIRDMLAQYHILKATLFGMAYKPNGINEATKIEHRLAGMATDIHRAAREMK